MSVQQQMFAIIASLVGQRNILTIPRVFIDLTGGDLHAALLLSQCVYWSDKGSKREFYKTDAEWRDELGLTDYRLRQSKKVLVEKGFITTTVKRANGAPTTHYRIWQEVITAAISRFVEGQQIESLTVNESESATVNESITKTTQETTPETTKDSGAPAPGAPAETPPALPGKRKRTRTRTERDDLWDAVVASSFGGHANGNAGHVGVVVKALRAAGVSAEEYTAAAAHFRSDAPGLSMPRGAGTCVNMVTDYRQWLASMRAREYADGLTQEEVDAAVARALDAAAVQDNVALEYMTALMEAT